MKKFIDKLISRLEEARNRANRHYNYGDETAYRHSIEIINKLAEEYNNSWISCSERLPEDCTIYEVTARFGNGMYYTEFAYYDESKGEWWKHDDDGLVNVLAWREHSAPYQPKGE